jgi:PilZ domain-containing protein
MTAADESAANEPTPEPEAEPSRRFARRLVSLEGYAVRPDGSTIDIRLLDLTYEGCGIETPVELRPGETVKLSVIGRGLIDAEVRWFKDGKAGLNFASDKSATKTKVPRRTERSSVTAEVKMRRVGQPNYNVRIFDLSPEGCKVEVVERPRVGEQLMIKFEGLEVLQAEVCWVESFIVGLKFERALHPAVFDLLVTRLQ